MATYYVDLVSGNDANPGTAGSPLLTVNAAVAKASGPHDIRVAKTPAPTTAGGATTFGWTKNSVSVTTSTDLTASIAAGNYIGKPTAAGNGAAETFYRVSSITSTTITLNSRYRGTTGNTTGALNHVVGTSIITTGTAAANAITLTTSGTILSGGWNLTGTPTQDGETWFKSNNARTASFIGIHTTTANVTHTISKMNIAETYQAFFSQGNGVNSWSISNCTACVYGILYSHSSATSYALTMDTVTAVGELQASGFSTLPAYLTLTNVNVFNFTIFLTMSFAGTTTSFSNVLVAGCTTGLSVTAILVSPTLTGLTIEYSTTGIIVGNSVQIITGGTVRNCTTAIATSSRYSIIIKDVTFSGNTTGISFGNIFGGRIQGCSFTSDNISISTDSTCNSISVSGCAFTTPTTWAIFKPITSESINITDCTIDVPSESKAFNNLSGANSYTPNAIIKNSFGTTWPDGFYWPYFRFYKDATTHSIAPSMSLVFTTSLPGNAVSEQTVSSKYTAASTSHTVSFYAKANATWAGTISPIWKLNGRNVKTETSITSLTTGWVLYTYTIASGLVTTDGIVEFAFIPNNNTIAAFIDDVVWS